MSWLVLKILLSCRVPTMYGSQVTNNLGMPPIYLSLWHRLLFVAICIISVASVAIILFLLFVAIWLWLLQESSALHIVIGRWLLLLLNWTFAVPVVLWEEYRNATTFHPCMLWCQAQLVLVSSPNQPQVASFLHPTHVGTCARKPLLPNGHGEGREGSSRAVKPAPPLPFSFGCSGFVALPGSYLKQPRSFSYPTHCRQLCHETFVPIVFLFCLINISCKSGCYKL